MAMLRLTILLLLGNMISCDDNFADTRKRLEKDLPAVISAAARKANSSVSIAIDHPLFNVTLADGSIGPERRARPEDIYALGSITKTMTGAAVMKLAAEGKLKLGDPAHLYVDPMLARARYILSRHRDLTKIRAGE